VVILTDDKLISGWDRKEERNPYFYELAARELQKRGVPESKIQVVSDIALGTYEESLGIRDYATAHQLKRLVGSYFPHITRGAALWSLRHACEGSGIEIGIDSPPPGWPNARALALVAASLGLESCRGRIREIDLLLDAVIDEVA